MTIASALENAHRKIENAYSVIEEKGGTLPEIQNLSNLSEAIESISGGGSVPIEVINKTGATVAKNQKVWINSDEPGSFNCTVVGNPTISSDSVISNFSTSNYLTTQLPNISQSFTLISRIYIPDTVSRIGSYGTTFSTSNGNSCYGIIAASPNRLLTYIHGGGESGTTQQVSSGWKWLRMDLTTSSTIMYVIDDAGYAEETLPPLTEWSQSCISSNNILNYFSSKTLYIGVNAHQGRSTANWQIDIKNTKYIADEVTIWKGATEPSVLDPKQIVPFDRINENSFTATTTEQIDNENTGLVYLSIPDDRKTIEVINKSGDDVGKLKKVWINTTENAAHFSKVGGVVVSNDFVASNFNASNFIMLDQVFTPNDNPWEVNLKLTWNGSSGEDYAFGSTSSGYLKVGLDSGRPCLYASRISTDWNIGSITANEALTPNVWYYLRASFTGSAYKLYLSTNGITYNQIAGGAETTPVVTFTDTTIGGGNTRWGSNYRGQIDLKECYIKINDEITWRGVSASSILDPKQIVPFDRINKNSFTAITKTEIRNNEMGEVYITSVEGGEGETIDVIAIDEAKSFDVDNKVILNVNDVMSDDLMKGVNTKTITIANTLDLGIKSPGGAITKDSILVPVNNFDRSTDLGAVVIGSRTSDTSWSLNDTLLQNISSVRMLDASTNLCIAIQRSSTAKSYKIGYLENGLFTPVSGAITFTESELSIVKCKDLVYEAHHGVVIDTSTEEMIQVPYRPGSIIIYYDNNYYAYSNGEEYILENDRLSWKATGFTSNINNSGIIGARMGNNSPISFQYLGDCSGKFFASSMIVFERVDGIPGQSNTTYKRNDKLTEALHIGPNIICFDVQKDNESDDYYIFIMDYSGKNILARFNDGNITILPSIFTDTNITGVIAAAMNWKDGLFMCGVLEEESTTQFHAKTYVKTINVASPYQYFTAGNNVRSLVSTDILSGFVKETNTDEYGNKVLTISTVTDPSEAPWSPNDIVYGFDVSIEPGEEILAVELNPETETNNVKGFVIDYDLTNLLGLPNNYTPVYKSTNNAIQSSYSYAKIEIDANKVSSVTLWINSFAETTYDYTTASALDGTKDATDLTTSGFQFNPRLGLDTRYWKTATYTIPQDGGNHWIWVRYRKDSSADKDDDTGRFTLSYTVR